MTHEYAPAVEALADADVTVFVLDASHADYHSLEIGLQQIADDTGGMYFRGSAFPRPPPSAWRGRSPATTS